MSIKFDSKACINALRTELFICMKRLQVELLERAKSGMLTDQGRNDLQDEEITDIANVIIAGITGGAWATMDEHGTGSKMDIDNPALDDYKDSPLWNPHRSDNNIRSRERGPYINILGDVVNSRSNRGGIDLEPKGGKFAPNSPSHAIETAIRWMANGDMHSAVSKVLSSFQFGRFIVTKK